MCAPHLRRLVKYLNKYIFKGHDRAEVEMHVDFGPNQEANPGVLGILCIFAASLQHLFDD